MPQLPRLLSQGYTDPRHPTLAELLQLSLSTMGELETWATLEGGHLISSPFPFLVSEALQKLRAEVSGQEVSFKHVTEKLALPRAHVAGMLPKAYDAEKMSPRDHTWTPASLPPGPGFRPLRSPWGKVAGPVALYGTVVEGWRNESLKAEQEGW